MGDNRNFTALDWVTGEITETLTQARQALESHVSNPDDSTQIRFCLTHLHEVHRILQMVEFHGGALLAEELEKLAQALVDDDITTIADAQEVLMRAMLQLPVYLETVKNTRRDAPNSLLPLLNDLRAVRKDSLLTETALFSPKLTAIRQPEGERANLEEEKFADTVKKLRQAYQQTLLSIIKDKEYDDSLSKLEKIFTNFAKISQGSAFFAFWEICLAVVEGLAEDSISANISLNNLFKEIEKVIKHLFSSGKAGLDHFEFEELSKNLLYYIAESNGEAPRIVQTKALYELDKALPQIDDGGSDIMGTEPDAMRSVVVALAEEFSKVKEVFDGYFNGQEDNNENLVKTLPVFKQAADTLAILGQGDLRKKMQALTESLDQLAAREALVTGDDLMDIAVSIQEVEGTLNSQFNKNAERDGDAPPSMDIAMVSAHETVLFECQNALEQAKDALVEFNASQWDKQHIDPLPELIMEIRGGLEMVNQRRSAKVLGACARYIKDKLIDDSHEPNFQEMDTLADAIAAVEYYLETLDEDVIEEDDTILGVAEDSVANLGYAVASSKRSDGEEESEEEEELDDVPELGDLASEEESGQAQASPLTKEKLDAIIAGDNSAQEQSLTDEKTAKQLEAEEKAAKRKQAETTQIPDDGPLLSDEEFDNIDTVSDDIELETDFSFDGLEVDGLEVEGLQVESVLAEDEQPEDIEINLDVEAISESIEPSEDQLVDVELENVGIEVVSVNKEPAPEEDGLIFDDFDDEDYDEEIAEIFVEEIEEVMENIAEFYPRWKAASYDDDEARSEFRRGFHTMKGSGRMAKALSVGELAWSVENMLNRVIDETISVDDRVIELIDRVLEKVPSMMEAFGNKQPDPDPQLSKRYRLIGEALSTKEEPLPFNLEGVSETTEEPAAIDVTEEVVVDEVATEVGFEEEVEEETDWELLEIFSSEAESHLEVVDEWLVFAKEQLPLPVETSDPLQRALHTLKGSAYMAEINEIAELAAPLEKFVKALRAFQITVEAPFVNLLDACAQEVRVGLEQIENKTSVELNNKSELLARIDEMRLALTGESENEQGPAAINAPQGASVDPSLFNQFLATGMDALLDADELLEAWQFTDDLSDVERLTAELKAMAIGAEPAGLAPIVSLCQILQQAYAKVLSAESHGKLHFIPLALPAHEALVNFIDELAGGQDLQTNEALETSLQAFIDSELPEQETAEETNVVSEQLNSDDFDVELLEIFAEEAEELLEELDEMVANWQDAPGDSSFVDNLKRNLHTFKGGARMAGLEVLGTLAHDLETELEALTGMADTAVFNKVHAYQDCLIKGTERTQQLISGNAVSFSDLVVTATDTVMSEPDVVELEATEVIVDAAVEDESVELALPVVDEGGEVERSEVEESITTNIPTGLLAVGDDLDTELLEIFIEEADELQDELEQTLANWQDTPTESKSNIDELKRILHTLKGGARMAGMSGLGSIAHDLETHLETFTGEADTALFAMLNQYQDGIIRGIDQAKALAAGEVPEALETESTVEDVIELEITEPDSIDIEVGAVDIAEVEITEAVPVVEESSESDFIVTIDAEYDEDLVEIFLEEADEMLESIENALLAWQAEPDNDEHRKQLERDVHTIKGGANMNAIKALGSVAHEVETQLENYRGSFNEGLLDLLNNFNDQMHAGLKQVRNIIAGEEPETTSDSAEVETEAEIEVVEREEGEQQTAGQDLAVSSGAEILPFKAAVKPVGLDKKLDKAAAKADKSRGSSSQEMVKVAAELIEELVNLAGETSISRGRVEQQVTDFTLILDEVDGTIARLQDQLRRMEIETEAQVQSKVIEFQSRSDDFDPLEMDHYSTLQQLTRSLMETSSDLIDLRAQLTNKARETEMVLLQQSRINTELQEGLMRSRMVPFSRMVPRLRRIVRQVTGELKKEVGFDLEGDEGEMDRTVLEKMVAPLEHMLRNALDHGIEMPADREAAGKPRRGRVVLSFGREGGDITITLQDDGGGIPVEVIRNKAIERGLITEDAQLSEQEILQFIMHAGFSTAEKVTQISGRGVGMDVVSSEIKQLGGTMQIDSILGQGTRFTVRLPFTVSVNRALMVKIGDDQFAVPLNSIEGIVRVSPFELEGYYQDPEARFEYAGELYEVRYLGALLQTKAQPNLEGLVLPEAVILVRGQDHAIALHVDQLLGSREVVVKSLGPQFGSVPGLSGATILGDGSVVIILDLMALVRSVVLLESQGNMLHIEQQSQTKESFTVMVVDDSVTVRKVTSRFLEREGFEVVLAKDGADAMLQLQDFVPDVMLLDIEMPRMDGFEVASAVKNNDRLRDIPIIMITSRTGDKHRERAMSLGVERYMGKPFVEDELLETVNELVAKVIQKGAMA